MKEWFAREQGLDCPGRSLGVPPVHRCSAPGGSHRATLGPFFHEAAGCKQPDPNLLPLLLLLLLRPTTSRKVGDAYS